jgi:hypothetical protein
MSLHPANDVFWACSKVRLRRRQVPVPQVRLDVDKWDRPVCRQPHSASVAEVVQRPVRTQLFIDSQQHCP